MRVRTSRFFPIQWGRNLANSPIWHNIPGKLPYAFVSPVCTVMASLNWRLLSVFAGAMVVVKEGNVRQVLVQNDDATWTNPQCSIAHPRLSHNLNSITNAAQLQLGFRFMDAQSALYAWKLWLLKRSNGTLLSGNWCQTQFNLQQNLLLPPPTVDNLEKWTKFQSFWRAPYLC